MLFLFLTLCVLLLLVMSIGKISMGLAGIKETRNPFLFVFVGLFAVSIIAMVASFWVPISITFQYGFIVIGLLGLHSLYQALKLYNLRLRDGYFYFSIIYLCMLLVLSYFFGYADYPYSSDTDMYHTNSILWLKSFGTVTGLANLSHRLGTNSTWHTFAAVVDHGLLNSRAVWVLPLFAYASASGYFLWEVCFGKKLWQKFFGICVTCWTFVNVLTWGFPSLHYDFIPLIYNAILFLETLHLVLHEEEDSHSIKRLGLLAVIATASFVLKPMAAVSILFLGILIVYKLMEGNVLNLKNVILIGLVPLFAVCVWLGRNIILSGWPLFPSLAISLDLDWTIPRAMTKKNYEDVLFWARLPGPGYQEVGNNSFMFWFVPWLKNCFVSVRFWFVGTIPFFAGVFFWTLNWSRLRNPRELFFFSWCLVSLVFWFSLAPDIRFGDGLIYVFMTTGMTFYLVSNETKTLNVLSNKNMFKSISTLYTIFFLAIGVTLFTGKRGPVNFLTIGRHLSGPIVQREIEVEGQEPLLIWTPIAVSDCRSSKLPKICLDNMNIYKGLSGCGNSPIPCTRYFSDKIRQIIPGDLGKGFYYDRK